MGDEWTLLKRIPYLAADLIAYHEQDDHNDKLLENAVMLFNEQPNKGVSFGIKNKIFSNKHSEICKFLLETKGLSKFAIGEYLSE